MCVCVSCVKGCGVDKGDVSPVYVCPVKRDLCRGVLKIWPIVCFDVNRDVVLRSVKRCGWCVFKM